MGRPLPGRPRPPQGAFPPPAVRRDRLRVGCEGLEGGRWPGRAPAEASKPSRGPAPARRYSPLPAGALAVARGRGRRPPPRPPPQPLRPRRAPSRALPRGRPRRGSHGGKRGRGWEDGAPRSRRGCRPGRTVLSAPRPRRAARVGTGPRHQVRQGSAAKSVTRPTRLETRTKESNARASRRAPLSAPRGAARTPCRRNEGEGREPSPAEVGSLRRRAEGAPPARLARSVGEVEHERAR